MPPPVIEFCIQKNRKENIAGIDDFGPAFLDTYPDGGCTKEKACNLVADLNGFFCKIQIADHAPIRKNQDRNKKQKHPENAVNHSETREFMMRDIRNHEQ